MNKYVAIVHCILTKGVKIKNTQRFSKNIYFAENMWQKSNIADQTQTQELTNMPNHWFLRPLPPSNDKLITEKTFSLVGTLQPLEVKRETSAHHWDSLCFSGASSWGGRSFIKLPWAGWLAAVADSSSVDKTNNVLMFWRLCQRKLKDSSTCSRTIRKSTLRLQKANILNKWTIQFQNSQYITSLFAAHAGILFHMSEENNLLEYLTEKGLDGRPLRFCALLLQFSCKN